MAENRRYHGAREEIGPRTRRLARTPREWRDPRVAMIALWLAVGGAGCAGPLRGPRTLATVGTALVVGGATSWVVGERVQDGALPRAVGLGGVASGLVALAIAGGWLATEISCRVDPDCREGEECREVPAPPGFEPYKQCVPR